MSHVYTTIHEKVRALVRKKNVILMICNTITYAGKIKTKKIMQDSRHLLIKYANFNSLVFKGFIPRIFVDC